MLTMKEKTILFVEDDPSIREPMKETLELYWKKVLTAENGLGAMEQYELYRPDLVLTDIKMPGKNGLSLIREIRESDYKMPIVLLSSYSEQEMLMETINLSVDGYLTKPVVLEKMIPILVRSLDRNGNKSKTVHLGAMVRYDRSSGELHVDDEPVALGKKEREMLNLLIEKYPGAVSKEEISARLWPLDSIADSTIKMLVMRLRRKIGPERIATVNGLGFRLED